MTKKKEEKSKEEKKPAPAPTLDAKQTKEITDFITERKKTEKDPKVIRKEIFDKFGVDITVYEFKWPEDTGEHVPVSKGKELAKARDFSKSYKENTDYEHKFTDAEIIELAKRRSMTAQEMAQIESRKKATIKDYDFQIQGKETAIGEMDNQVSNGFEIRHCTAEVIKDYKAGVKRYSYLGKEIKVIPLTDSERQLEFEEFENK